MKLNKKGRDELREMVEKELSNIPDGERVLLDKKTLDMLLFETILYKKNPKKIVKLPVWSGAFLKKLDLSQVSFRDVSWSLLGGWRESELGKRFFDEDCWRHFVDNYGQLNGRVNYSGTNIHVNFNLSWEMQAAKQEKEDAGVEIYGCDFSFVDLSKVDTSNFLEVRSSNFSNTGLVLSKKLLKSFFSVFFYTDLSNNNLGNVMVNLLDIITIGGPVIGVGCNLANTRISIVLDPKSISDETSKNNFRTILMAGDLNGCFINGKKVLSVEERKEIATKKLKEYEQFKQKEFDQVKSSIQKQLGTISQGRK